MKGHIFVVPRLFFVRESLFRAYYVGYYKVMARNIDDVKEFWNSRPLLTEEHPDPLSDDFFESVNSLKKEDIDRIVLDKWNFNGYEGKKVLEIGCGPGWYTVNYALGKADIIAIDLTESAIDLTKRHCAYRQAEAQVQLGNAEELDFEDNQFDLVMSSGVLHHTPDCSKAITETFRVLKSGGDAKISLYHKGILLKPWIFSFTIGLVGLLRVKTKKTEFKGINNNPENFVRQYDGKDNPVGIAKTKVDWEKDFKDAGYEVVSTCLYYLPMRFIPFSALFPGFLKNLLNKWFGTMILFDLKKP